MSPPHQGQPSAVCQPSADEADDGDVHRGELSTQLITKRALVACLGIATQMPGCPPRHLTDSTVTQGDYRGVQGKTRISVPRVETRFRSPQLSTGGENEPGDPD